jgi:primosomal protein N'
MYYKCKKCNYEFEVTIVSHPHTGLFVPMGCPICKKAQAMSKPCTKCGSKEIDVSIKKIE